MSKIPELELDFYARMLSKIRHKKYEFLVVSAIFHMLNDRSVEVTTQQLIRTNSGYFLLDLYFPQLKLAIEIDEPYHNNKIDIDKKRERAVIQASDIEFIRISISNKSLDNIYDEIRCIIKLINEKKARIQSQGQFEQFKFGKKYNTEYWLNKRLLSNNDDARFTTHAEVAKLFGRHYKNHQRAIIKLDDNNSVWFPKLYINNDWDNKIIDNGKTITMTLLSSSKLVVAERFNRKIKNTIDPNNFYVFSHHKDEFGQIYYAFKGIFNMVERDGINAKYSLTANSFEFDGNGYFQPRYGTPTS